MDSWTILELVVFVAIGGALGGVARFFVSGFVGRRIGETFPWGTMAVNVSGALMIGIMAGALTAEAIVPDRVWPLIVTGFLGCYTTVSSFSLQSLTLFQVGEWRSAAGNVVGSLISCLMAVFVGYHAALSVLDAA